MLNIILEAPLLYDFRGFGVMTMAPFFYLFIFFAFYSFYPIYSFDKHKLKHYVCCMAMQQLNNFDKGESIMKIEATKRELEILGRGLQTLVRDCADRIDNIDGYNYDNPTLGQKIIQDRENDARKMGDIITKLWKEAK